MTRRSSDTKAARREKSRKWREAHADTLSEHYKHYNLKKYNLTLVEYQVMWLKQGGSCAVCGQEETSVLAGKVKDLAVDHNHTTGKVRALLCHKCNTLIGLARESSLILANASTYLKAVNTP